MPTIASKMEKERVGERGGGMQREAVREGEGEIERDAERGREKYYQIAI